jgi:DHA2 family multidrug resistance protein-like MFS transporter
VAGGSVAISIVWSGAMLEHFWRGAIFLGVAAVAAAALLGGWSLLPTSRHPDQAGTDPVGAALPIVGTTGLLYGFIQVPDDGWAAGQIVAAFALFGMYFALAQYLQLVRGYSPLVAGPYALPAGLAARGPGTTCAAGAGPHMNVSPGASPRRLRR